MICNAKPAPLILPHDTLTAGRKLLFCVFLAAGVTGILCAGDLPVGRASSFRVHEEAGYTLVEITQAWPGASRSFEYALVDRERGDPDAVPQGVRKIKTPVRRVISTSTTFIAGFEALGALERIAGTDNPDFLYSEEARARVQRGEIRSVGSGMDLDLELIVDLEPDLVMINQYDPSDQTASRLEDAGLPVLINADWTEHSPVGRMEWIYLIGLLVGESQEAAAYARDAAARYESLRARAADVDSRPRVLINGPFEGSWALPQADAFSARFIEDAGGDYIWSNEEGTGSIFLDTEAVYERAGDADFWINPGMWRSLEEIPDERLFEFDAVLDGSLYNVTRRVSERGGMDYFESGQYRPDDILADLIHIFHPDVLPDHELVFYEQLR